MAVLLSLAGTSALAQASLDQVQSCLALEGEKLKLSCIDALAGAGAAEAGSAEQAQTESQPVIDLTAQVEVVNLSAARDSDPAAANAVGTMRRGVQIEDAEQSVLVTGMNTNIPGAIRFICADGRVFKQTDAGQVAEFLSPPFNARIEDGQFGATFMVFDNGRRLRVALQN
jgi:hypothetical protein